MYIQGFLSKKELTPEYIGEHTCSIYKLLADSKDEIQAEPYVKHIVANLNNPTTLYILNPTNLNVHDALKIKNMYMQANSIACAFTYAEHSGLSYIQKSRLSFSVITWLCNYNSKVSKLSTFNKDLFKLDKLEERTDIAMANIMLTSTMEERISKMNTLVEVMGNKSNNGILKPEDFAVIRYLKENLHLFNSYKDVRRNAEVFINFVSGIRTAHGLVLELSGRKMKEIWPVYVNIQNPEHLKINSECLPTLV